MSCRYQELQSAGLQDQIRKEKLSSHEGSGFSSTGLGRTMAGEGNGQLRLITGLGSSVCAGTANGARSCSWKINLCPLLIQPSLINCERAESGNGFDIRITQEKSCGLN